MHIDYLNKHSAHRAISALPNAYELCNCIIRRHEKEIALYFAFSCRVIQGFCMMEDPESTATLLEIMAHRFPCNVERPIGCLLYDNSKLKLIHLSLLKCFF